MRAVESLVVAVLLASSALGAQSHEKIESPRVRALHAGLATSRDGSLARFWASVRKTGSPLVEAIPGDPSHLLVTFVFRGDDSTRNVAIIGGAAGYTDLAANAFQHLDGSDVWYRSFSLRRDARFQYKIQANADLTKLDMNDTPGLLRRLGAFKLDPLNPHRIPVDTVGVEPLEVNSTVELPGAPRQPYLAKRSGVPAGRVFDTVFTSRIMGNERKISVYTPPAFAREKGPYDLLIAFDREGALDVVPTPTILDNLIADRRVPPIVAVFVSNPNDSRSAELPCNKSFADFLATELAPWAHERFAASDAPARSTLTGASYGGLASTCGALFHPERFGNVLSQSGSYWWGPDTVMWKSPEWVLAQFEASPKLPIRFYQNVGLMETGPTYGEAPNMVVTNRHLRDLLRAKGYEVRYVEFNGAHEPLNWRGYLADGLIALLGSRATRH